jgi:hypothetical protein
MNVFAASLWLMFLAGQGVHILKRAGMCVRSPANAVTSRRQFVRLHWDALLIRGALCAGIFAVALDEPALLSRLAGAMGVSADLSLRMNPGTSLVFGYFADSVLDWLASHIPVLQREVPTVAGSAPDPKKAEL